MLHRSSSPRSSSSSVLDRQLAAVQVHPAGCFKADPFCEANAALMYRGSDIITAMHTRALLRLLDGRQPHMQLLYSGKRDGMTAADFHRLCDGKGPTLTVIRTRPSDGSTDGRIIGGWAGESWSSSNKAYAASTWLFSLGVADAAGAPTCVSKYCALSTAADQVISSHSKHGPAFGPNGYGLRVSNFMTEQYNSAHLQGYQLAAGYTAYAGDHIGGALYFAIGAIEVWTCPLPAQKA